MAGEPGGVDGMERRTLGYLDSLPAATRSLAAVKPDAVVLAHTAVSYLSRFAGEAALRAGLADLTGIRTSFTDAAAIPPPCVTWASGAGAGHADTETISADGRAYWEAAGFEVVSHHPLDTPNIYEETEARAHALGRNADVPPPSPPDQRHRPPTAGVSSGGERPRQARRDQPGRNALASPPALGIRDAVTGYGGYAAGGQVPAR